MDLAMPYERIGQRAWQTALISYLNAVSWDMLNLRDLSACLQVLLSE